MLRTAVMREDVFDDGVTIFIEATHDDGEPHAIGVYIDHNFGGMATDVVLADSIDRVEELLVERTPTTTLGCGSSRSTRARRTSASATRWSSPT